MKISCSDILLDVDGVISCGIGSPAGSLQHVLMDDFGLTHLQAMKKIKKVTGLKRWEQLKSKALTGDIDALFELASRMKVSQKRLWKEIIRDGRVLGFKDASYMVKTLWKEGYNLYIASMNAGWSLFLKLGYAGLCGLKGSKYFKGFLNGDILSCKKSSSPNYYRKVAKHLGKKPNNSVMIGDWERQDLYPALKAGIKTIIIIRRGQKEKIKTSDAIYVNSLRLVPDLLKRKYYDRT